MYAPLSTLVRSLATITLLAGFVFASGRAQATHAGTVPVLPVICTRCPHLPLPPTLGPLQLTTSGNAVIVQGQGFSSWGGVDLYVWQHKYPAAVDTYTFAGTVHTTAHGSALNVRLAPLVYVGPSDRNVPCLDYNTIYVVAIDEGTDLGSGMQTLISWCDVLQLPAVMAHPSLQAVLNAPAGTLHISGHHYTPHTAIAVYLLQNGSPLWPSYPTTLKAKVTQFMTTLSTGYKGCSDTLSWTTFALDRAANVASPMRMIQDPCYSPPPPK